MNSTLRSSAAAAALLLGSLGAMLASGPAAAQHRAVYLQAPVVQQPAIERFVVRGNDSLEPGRELRFRLVGTPGRQAWLELPGVLRAVPMTETRPGVYERSYVVRRRDDPEGFSRAVATLQGDGQRVSAQLEQGERGQGWGRRRDDRAPQITGVTPDHGERIGDRGWTRIAARFSDDGSGIDPRSVTLRLDGRDVTGRTRVDEEGIRYRDELAAGRHVAELVVRDRAGNATRRSWSFDVVERDHGDDDDHHERDRGNGSGYSGYSGAGYSGGQRW